MIRVIEKITFSLLQFILYHIYYINILTLRCLLLTFSFHISPHYHRIKS